MPDLCEASRRDTSATKELLNFLDHPVIRRFARDLAESAEGSHEIFEAVYRHLDEGERQAYIATILESLRSSSSSLSDEHGRSGWGRSGRSEWLRVLSPYLSREQLRTALNLAESIGDSEERAWLGLELFPYLAEPAATRALHGLSAVDLDFIHLIKDLEALPDVFDMDVSPEQWKRLLDAVVELEDVTTKLCLLAKLVRTGDPEDRTALMDMAVDALLAELQLEDFGAGWMVRAWLDSLDAAVGNLNQAQLERIMAALPVDEAQRAFRARALAIIAPAMEEPRRKEVVRALIATFGSLPDDEDPMQMRIEFIERLPDEAQDDQVTAVVGEIGSPNEYTTGSRMQRLAPHMSASNAVVALQVIAEQGVDKFHENTFGAIYPRLDATGREKLLTLIKTMEKSNDRLRAWTELLPLTPADERATLALTTWDEAVTAEFDGYLAEYVSQALACAAPYMPEAEVERVLEIARGLEKGYLQTAIIVALASYKSEDARDFTRMVADFLRTSPDRWIVDGLGDLLPHLPDDEQMDVLIGLGKAVLPVLNSQHFQMLAPALGPAAREQVVDAMVRSLNDTEDEKVVVDLLRGFAPFLSPTQIVWALEYIVEKGTDGPEALEILAQLGESLPDESAFHLWSFVLSRRLLKPREELVPKIRAMVPVLVGLGGNEAAAELYNAVDDVGNWWP